MHQADELDPLVNHFLICMASELYFPISDFPKSAYGTCLTELCKHNYFKNRHVCFQLDKLQSAFSLSYSHVAHREAG